MAVGCAAAKWSMLVQPEPLETADHLARFNKLIIGCILDPVYVLEHLWLST